jgi:Vps51/Vps67
MLSGPEMRQLDGERQSLVYNHHHELIDATDTISAVSRLVARCFFFLSLYLHAG